MFVVSELVCKRYEVISEITHLILIILSPIRTTTTLSLSDTGSEEGRTDPRAKVILNKDYSISLNIRIS